MLYVSYEVCATLKIQLFCEPDIFGEEFKVYILLLFVRQKRIERFCSIDSVYFVQQNTFLLLDSS